MDNFNSRSAFESLVFNQNSSIENLDFKFENPQLNFYASKKYEHIMQQICEFEKNLDNEHEIALKLSCFGSSLTLQVTDIGYQNPELLYFFGYINGKKSQLIQHINQLNFLITAVEKQDKTKPPKRIGKIDFNTNDN